MSSIGNEFDAWVMNKYAPGSPSGFYRRERFDLMSFIWDDNGTLKALAASTTGTVGFKYVTGGTNATDKIMGLVWNASADQTDILVKDWALPTTWKKDGGAAGSRSKIILAAKVRKLDASGSASDNADLALLAQASWHNSNLSASENTESDGDSTINNLGTLATPVPVTFETLAGAAVIPTDAVADSEAAFRWMFADITAGMTAAQLAALKPGATMTFKIYPNEAIGTNLALEVVEIAVICLEHLVPQNRFEKNRAKG
jgi:hypothetical protein